MDFHRTIADATGNRLLMALVSALHQVTHPLGYIDASPDLARQSIREHRQIVAAIRAGDEEMAAETMGRHLQRLRDAAAAVPSAVME